MKRYMDDCRFNGKKILIADDCNEITKLFAAMLSRTGAEVTESFDGRDVLLKIGEQRFDLIILDFHMTDIDGAIVAQVVKKSGKNTHCPVVIISSDHDKIDELKNSLQGIENFIEKPFSPVDVLNKIAQIFDPLGNKGSSLCLGDDCKSRDFKKCSIFSVPEMRSHLSGTMH